MHSSDRQLCWLVLCMYVAVAVNSTRTEFSRIEDREGIAMIFDSHAHYDDKQFDVDRDELLSSMGENNIRRIVNVGADIKSSERSVALAEQYDFVYAAIGVHPSEIGSLEEADMQWLKETAAHEKVVAIGEIGLDYYWDKELTVQEQQRYWFRRQLELARETSLPVIIHSREAAADTMEIMKNCAQGIPGVIHCFSYSKEQAAEYVKMGYYIGVGGVITFQNARKLKEAVAELPIERIVVETDCPYLAPVPNRGKRNFSQNLPYVIHAIAELKGMTPEDVEEITFRNAMELYGMR